MAETERVEWTVVTWNVLGAKQPDLDRLADHIRRESPDVVAIQEIRRRQAVGLAERLGMRFTWSFKHNAWRPFFPSWAEGAAILTPHRLEAPAHTVISDVTSKRNFRRRILQWALVGRDDATAYFVYNLHLSPHGAEGERLDEADRVTEIVVANGDAPPAIVAGDLNDEHDPEVIGRLPGIEHVPPPPTNPADAPRATIDHVLLPADATDVAVSVPAGGPAWRELSDHLPVTVRFTMPWVRGDFDAR